MINANTYVSLTSVIESQFPSVYQDEGQDLIEFISAYYEWLETTPYGAARELLSLRDIDQTVDEFLLHFKSEYLAGLPNITTGSIRFFIKHASDFYNSRGTEAGLKLFFRLLFGIDARVYIPGADIIKASDGEWIIPQYLELTISPKTASFVGQQITGISSKATAFVESVSRRFSQGKYFDVAYISYLNGNFQTGEIITSDGNLDGCPSVEGSLNQIIVTNGGANNNIGDIVNVNSFFGKAALARVTNIASTTGLVTFTLVDGGSEYSNNASVYVSNTIINITNASSTFQNFETIKQPLANVSFISANNSFTLGQKVDGWTSGTWIKQGSGTIVNLVVAGANGAMIIAKNSDYDQFGFADTLRLQGNTITATITSATDITATGNVVGSNSTAVGIMNVVNTFYGGNTNFIVGLSSNTTANVVSFGAGTGASFSIGKLSSVETIYLNTDKLSANNTAGVPFKYIQLDGEGSGIGAVANVSIGQKLNITGAVGSFSNNDLVSQSNSSGTIATGIVYASNSTVVSVYTYTGTFGTAAKVTSSVANATVSSITNDGGTSYVNNDIVTFGGGGSTVTSIVISAGGTAFANGERLVFTSNSGAGALGVVSTNSTGGITGTTLISNGHYYVAPPIVSVNTAHGTSANLIAVMTAALPANGTVTTNTTGGLASISISNTGANLCHAPVLTFPHGSGANYLINMNYGYGFTKLPSGNSSSALLSLFTFIPETVGVIQSIGGVSPGSNYNEAPFVQIVDPLTICYNAKDYIISITNASSTFILNENIRQSFSSNAAVLTYTGVTGNSSFSIGELVTQGAINGVVTSQNTSAIILYPTNGTFINTANTSTKITGVITNATANVSNVSYTTLISSALGTVKSISGNNVYVRRDSLLTSFSNTGYITGLISGATANIVLCTADASSLVVGDNAVVTNFVGNANGTITSLQVLDSGYGFASNEILTITNPNSNYQIAGTAQLITQGQNQGYWKSTKGFLDADKYIQDSLYYQAFSYEIQTGISIDKYSALVNKLIHMSGMAMFGKTLISKSITSSTNIMSSSITQH